MFIYKTLAKGSYTRSLMWTLSGMIQMNFFEESEAVLKCIKKIAAVLLLTSTLSGCITTEFQLSETISLLAREDGSGTRGTFSELFNLVLTTEEGGRKDITSKEAIIVNKTDVMLQSVQSNPQAIGYVSIGSLNENVKTLMIDHVEPTADNIKNGSYTIARPFNIAIKDGLSELAEDFISFIFSREGQEIVMDSGYIPVDFDAEPYAMRTVGGRITVSGSSSVTPVMEKLQEAYVRINPHVIIEIQMSDSSSGMASVLNGTCDIGMASRDLKLSEKEFLQEMPIAIDGIAIIVNIDNSVISITETQVNEIFTGKILTWQEVVE